MGFPGLGVRIWGSSNSVVRPDLRIIQFCCTVLSYPSVSLPDGIMILSFPSGSWMNSGFQFQCTNFREFCCFYDHRLRDGIQKIFVKKDFTPNQTTQSFLHVLLQFLFVRKVENETYTYTSLNFSLVILIEAKKSSINNESKNREFQQKFHHFSGLKIRA